MRRQRSFFYHILIFVLAQIAWLFLLGLWIYWYLSNYIIFNEVGEKASPYLMSEGKNLFALIGGLFLLVTLAVAIFLLFHRLNIHFNLTRLYDNFIANVTHELKSPLASIQLYLETMQSHKLPYDKQVEFTDLMLKDTQRLNHLINTILEIPGLEQKKIAHDYRIYTTDNLIKELRIEALTQFNLSENAIQIQGEAPCPCVVDRNALKIVMNNLIDNSIKYSLEPVQITFTLSRNSKYIVIEYEDQGIGIATKDHAKVFQKFVRIYNRNIPNVKGTGLGLYWVKQILSYHGGKISIGKRKLQKGVLFKIELPIYKATKKRYISNLLKAAQRTYTSKKSS